MEVQVTGKKTIQVKNFISESKIINGKTWFMLNEFGEIFWIRNSIEGQIEAIDFFGKKNLQNKEAVIAEIFVYKFPYLVGDSYLSDDSLIKVEEEKHVTVPAGKFKCTVYFIDSGNGNYSRSCIAKGVGVITNEYMADGVLERSILINYGDTGSASN